ncbi:hypothetical protein DFH06DRAFT_1191633 [Mycena polygramma]|nr:hypothetical protein DFH06DRAFT_1191633 [Mycena polygramma]
MAALLPLAALTLLATASISGPASVLFRAIRRVVLPAPRRDVPPLAEQTAVAKAAHHFFALLFRSFTSVFAFASPRATLLPVFREPGDNTVPGTPLPTPPIPPEDGVRVGINAEMEKVPDVAEPPALVAVDGPATAAPPTLPRRQTKRVPRTYVDFTIGWDDVWPERAHCLPKYTYNSYFNAYTLAVPQAPMPIAIPIPTPPAPAFAPSDADSDSDGSSGDDDDESDSEVDVLELAARSADDDLLWAFHSLSLSDTAPPRSPPPCPGYQPPPAPAGMSPFCPPPLPAPAPQQTTTSTTWRLEWY